MSPTLTWTMPGAWPARLDRSAARRETAGDVPAFAGSSSTDSKPSLLDLSEEALIEACLDGRSGAFDLVVERHRRGVYQLCYRFVGNHEDASDLSQDIFLRAYRGLRNFRGQASLATWLYRIGVNVCLNRAGTKRLVVEPIGDREYVDRHVASPSERLIAEERDARVRAAIAELPRKQRATLILRVYHEMSHQEIADVLGNSVGAAKANLFHALGNLKKRLGDGGTGE